MKFIIHINEMTFPRLFIAALLRRDIFILSVEPLIPKLKPTMNRLVDLFCRRGWARRLLDLFPEYRHVIEQPATIYIYNIFAETESWLETHYALADTSQKLPDYGTAICDVTCMFAVPRYLPILLLHEAIRRYGPENLRIVGLLADMAAQFEAYHRYSLPQGTAFPRAPNALLNILQSAFMVLAGTGWILSRIKIPTVKPEHIFLAADYVEDPRDFRLYAELADGGPILLVVRSSWQPIESIPELKDFRYCRPTDGAFNFRGAVSALVMLWRDTWRILRACRQRPPALFYLIAALPVRRAILRAFFTRFCPRFFWGRDDYNVEHILRRQEIHKIGGTSLGVLHGAPGVAILEPMWRYVDFDRYFMFGKAVYDTHWKKTWPSDMEIVPAGTFGASREDYAQIGAPLPNDIIMFTSVFADSEKLPAFVKEIASAFPKRRIILSPKRTVTHLASVKRILAACVAAAPNVSITNEPNLFKKLRSARYAFSDASTTVIEGIQFGLFSFFLDLSDRHRACYYRYYPALCISDAQEAIKRVRDIESDSQAYPRESFDGLISLRGQVFFDSVRESVGLTAKEPTIPIVDRLKQGVAARAEPVTLG